MPDDALVGKGCFPIGRFDFPVGPLLANGIMLYALLIKGNADAAEKPGVLLLKYCAEKTHSLTAPGQKAIGALTTSDRLVFKMYRDISARIYTVVVTAGGG